MKTPQGVGACLLLLLPLDVAAASLPGAFLEGIGQRAVADSPEKYMAMGFLCFVLFSRAPRRAHWCDRDGCKKSKPKFAFLYVGEIFMPQHEDISLCLSLSLSPSTARLCVCVCELVCVCASCPWGPQIPPQLATHKTTHLHPPAHLHLHLHMHMCALDLLSILFVIIVVAAAAASAFALLLFTLTQFGIVLKINGTLVALAWPGRRTENGTESENCTALPARSQK